MPDNTAFYRNIRPFSNFLQVADPGNYQIAPDDWSVVITDIENSTIAVDEGRYKDVNMIGAASINAVLNVSEPGEIPYVFGGDGATLLVPSNRLEASKQALMALSQMSLQEFGLTLRVGVVPVNLLNTSRSKKVLVGKYALSKENSLAAFYGGGIELAEEWIKSDVRYLCQSEEILNPPDLSGLSCRWEPLANQAGTMLSVLVRVIAEDESDKSRIYQEIIGSINDIVRQQPDEGKPVQESNMRFRWPPRGLKTEIITTARRRNRFVCALGIYINCLLQWALDRFDLTAGGYRGRHYRKELRDNTDFRRFDDTLRILLDCSYKQAQAIEALLSEYHQKGEIVWGVHRASSALMTCLVFDLHQGQHIHFVDGNDGGFTSAAKAMKSLSGSSISRNQ